MKKLLSLVLCMMLSLFALPLLTVSRPAAGTDEPAARTAADEPAALPAAAPESWDQRQTVTVCVDGEKRAFDLRSYLIGVMNDASLSTEFNIFRLHHNTAPPLSQLFFRQNR